MKRSDKTLPLQYHKNTTMPNSADVLWFKTQFQAEIAAHAVDSLTAFASAQREHLECGLRSNQCRG